MSFSLLKFSFQVGLSRDQVEVNRQDGRLLFPVGRHQERLGRGHQKSVSPFVIVILQFRKKTYTGMLFTFIRFLSILLWKKENKLVKVGHFIVLRKK